MGGYVQEVLDSVSRRYPWETEFLQAVREVLLSLESVVERNPAYRRAKILERLVEPERVIMFRVPWQDDRGDYQVNRGYRVQFNNAIGPYKGGLRFHAAVNLSVLKFLGFEQIFKNSLTGLSLGGAKGGADFSVKGRSDEEVMRFCQSFMSELFRHIGADTDVPAGDIGVGGREIGFLFGQYKKLRNVFEGVLTGKGIAWGGSLVRPEATGYGCVYFAEEMLKTRNQGVEGKRVAISGSGNVAQYAAQKIAQLGGVVVTLSDSDGTVVDEEGISGEKWEFLMHLKNIRRGRIGEYAEKHPSAVYHEGAKPWRLTEAQIALPCAIQNELDEEGARALADNGCLCVAEGANMPCTLDAVDVLHDRGLLFGPGKAANAGGVAVSGLEMVQNSMRVTWSAREVDRRLRRIMVTIHRLCREAAEEHGTPGNYVHGANIAGFTKVADAMLDQGLV
ncbi:MAG: NADP-specific glutamate dehydrogenase [Spirochaetota bacterium]